MRVHQGPGGEVDPMAQPRRQPMPFEPIWYRTGVAMCSGACDQGRQPCSTPDACRLSAERGDRHNPSPVFSGLLSWPALLSAALVICGGIAAVAAWW